MPAPGLSTSMLRPSRPHWPPLSGSALVRISIATSTIGSSTTSLRPLSSRSACRTELCSAGRRSRPRSKTGSVEASAAPRIAASGTDRSSRYHAAPAIRMADSTRAGAHDEADQQLVGADFRQIERDAVGEQHEHQRQRGDDAQHLGFDAGIEQAEHAGADQKTHGEEDRDLRHAGAIDPPRQQRRHHDDGADERQHREEGFHQIIQPRTAGEKCVGH